MKSRKSRQMILAAFTLTATILIALTVVFKEIQKENDRHHFSILSFSEASDASHSLQENILKSRTLLLNNYDPLVNALQVLDARCNRFKTVDFFGKFSQNELKEYVDRYCQSVVDQADQVEQFKSVNSLLKNSLRYLPNLIEQVEVKTQSPMARETLNLVLMLYLEPGPQNFELLTKQVNWIDRTKSLSSKSDLALLKRHLISFTNALERRSELEGLLTSENLDKNLQLLESHYFSVYENDQRQKEYFHRGIFLLCILLGITLTLIVLKLNRTSQKLVDLNVDLEARVESRTAELATALSNLEKNQQALSNSARMSAVGEMAGGIAHEINTPLGTILLAAELLQKKPIVKQDEDLGSSLDMIVHTVMKISRIVAGLKSFSRDRSNATCKPELVSCILDDTLAVCQQKFKNHSIQLEVSEIPEHLEISCVSEQVSQALLNLLNNSYDAIQTLPNPWIRINVNVSDDAVEISVTDSGPGIPKEIRMKLMQPFFTTKPPGKGTGLGLSISKGLIESQNGLFYLDEKSQNTRFVIKFKIYNEYQVA